MAYMLNKKTSTDVPIKLLDTSCSTLNPEPLNPKSHVPQFQTLNRKDKIMKPKTRNPKSIVVQSTLQLAYDEHFRGSKTGLELVW